MSDKPELMSVRGRGARGRAHIAIPPESGTLWSRTVCGLKVLPQFPAKWSGIGRSDMCWNCTAFHEHDLLAKRT